MMPNINNSLTAIHQKLCLISPISIEELEFLIPIMKIENLSAGEYFINPGESANKIAFNLKGLAKTYYIVESGKEYITHFSDEGSFVGVYTDMLKNGLSTGHIQAIEDCTLMVMNYLDLLEATKNSLAWAHLLRKVAENRYIYRSDKDRNITQKSANDRYDYFVQTYPLLVDRLPQNQIALYLNINAATLSRLKNNSGKYKK
jgi:CRP-like cAMP-binding protein